MLCKKNIAILEGDRHQVDSGLDSIPPHVQKHADSSNGIFVHSKTVLFSKYTCVRKLTFVNKVLIFFSGNFIKTVFHCSHCSHHSPSELS